MMLLPLTVPSPQSAHWGLFRQESFERYAAVQMFGLQSSQIQSSRKTTGTNSTCTLMNHHERQRSDSCTCRLPAPWECKIADWQSISHPTICSTVNCPMHGLPITAGTSCRLPDRRSYPFPEQLGGSMAQATFRSPGILNSLKCLTPNQRTAVANRWGRSR